MWNAWQCPGVLYSPGNPSITVRSPGAVLGTNLDDEADLWVEIMKAVQGFCDCTANSDSSSTCFTLDKSNDVSSKDSLQSTQPACRPSLN